MKTHQRNTVRETRLDARVPLNNTIKTGMKNLRARYTGGEILRLAEMDPVDQHYIYNITNKTVHTLPVHVSEKLTRLLSWIDNPELTGKETTSVPTPEPIMKFQPKPKTASERHAGMFRIERPVPSPSEIELVGEEDVATPPKVPGYTVTALKDGTFLLAPIPKEPTNLVDWVSKNCNLSVDDIAKRLGYRTSHYIQAQRKSLNNETFRNALKFIAVEHGCSIKHIPF